MPASGTVETRASQNFTGVGQPLPAARQHRLPRRRGSSNIDATSPAATAAPPAAPPTPSPRSGSRGSWCQPARRARPRRARPKPVRRIAATSVSRATSSRVCTVACSVAEVDLGLGHAGPVAGTFQRGPRRRHGHAVDRQGEFGLGRVCIIVTVPGYGSGRLSNVNLSGFEWGRHRLSFDSPSGPGRGRAGSYRLPGVNATCRFGVLIGLKAVRWRRMAILIPPTLPSRTMSDGSQDKQLPATPKRLEARKETRFRARAISAIWRWSRRRWA